MENDMTDSLDRRLRAARPWTPQLEADAFDAELLARVRTQPIAARHRVSRVVAAPVAAGVTLTAVAVVMLGGGPSEVGGPSSASAITQALHWLNPPPHTIVHSRSVEVMGSRTTTRESWQSSDHPAAERLRVEGARTVEIAGKKVYDPATNTIYARGRQTAAGAIVSTGAIPAGDPIVDKVRDLLQDGRAVVSEREVDNGSAAFAISLKPDAGRPVWTLWVSAADGKPLELRDPGIDASAAPHVIRWTTYEVLPDTGASQLLTLKGAHPTAHIVDAIAP